MSHWSRVFGDEAGLTLVELLVTVAIMGIAFAAVLGGMTTSIQLSALHRQQTTAETLVRTYAEDVKKAALTGWGAGCEAPSAYSSSAVGLDLTGHPGYTAVPTGVTYWQPSGSSGSFVATCSSDTGLQQVTLRVSDGGRVQDVLQVLVRKP